MAMGLNEKKEEKVLEQNYLNFNWNYFNFCMTKLIGFNLKWTSNKNGYKRVTGM
jgi:hypothetical protein